MKPHGWMLFAVLALAPGLSAAQTASERLDRLSAEAQERVLDLFPVSEVFTRGPGPWQALGYKIGELTILELRAEAEKRLGARFDLRAFHDTVLAEGHLPIGMLRQRMGAWIEAQGQ
jgi:Bacterial protein of unknown function (DUF885)